MNLGCEIEADREVVCGLAEHIGGESNEFKEFAAWLSKGVSRIKLSYHLGDGFGRFEALEFLELGIPGTGLFGAPWLW
jgi:hypothetical protein